MKQRDDTVSPIVVRTQVEDETLGIQSKTLACLRINFLFVVDLYNEGVDIPEIDTVLFLRPTESLTVFLQQLGRGLRLFDDKECLTVLDFVGQTHRNFRFDLRFRALLTDPLVSIAEQVEHGFTHLPAGCTILMERVARQHILDNIKQTLRQTKPTLLRDLRELAATLGRRPSFGEFLTHTQVEPDDLYRRQVSYSRLCVETGLVELFSDPDEIQFTKGLGRIAHTNDAAFIHQLLRWLDSAGTRRASLPPDDPNERRLLMADLSLWGRSNLPLSSAESLQRIESNPTLRDEMRELLNFRLEAIDSVPSSLTLPYECPLTLHAHYTRDEVLAALGFWTREKQKEFREGVLHLQNLKTDVFFFTLNKSEKQYSPTTMYQDYAINERLFHWQSQSTTSVDSPTGRRYIEHAARGYTVLLFGREKSTSAHSGLSQPFAFLGPAHYVSHTGSRPVSFTWELQNSLPSRLFRTLARLSVA